MTTKQRKIKAVISSIAALILCFSMMLGVTMAWFTDTTTNNGNRIVTGGIGVELWKHTGEAYVNISDGTGDIFVTEGEEGVRLNGILWEPGKTEVVYLQVRNSGNLALNYNIILDIQNDSTNTAKLNEVLTYAIIPGDYSSNPFTSWEAITQLGAEMGAVPEGETTAAEHGALKAGESDFFALAVHMDEDAPNNYQRQGITIDVKIAAKQMASENDSFGNQYDAEAGFENKADEEEEDQAPRGNLLVNSGFETLNAEGTGFEGWINESKKIAVAWGTTHSADTTTFVTGTQSVKISTETASTNAAIRQDVALTVGRTYVVSGYFRVSQGVLDAYSSSNVVVNYAQYGNGAVVVKGKNAVLCGEGTSSSPCVVDQETVVADTWLPFSFEFTAVEGADTATIFFRQNIPGGTVWFDDLCVIDKAEIIEEKPEEPEAPVNMLVNPSFETLNAEGTGFEGWINESKKIAVAWGTTHSADTTTFVTGTQSVKISTETASTNASIRQDVTLTAGRTYVVSGYFRVSQGVLDAYSSSNVVVNYAQYGNGAVVVKAKNAVLCGEGTSSSPCVVDQETVVADSWLPFSFEFTAVEGADTAIIFFRQNLPGGAVWFDDLCVMEKTDAA